MDRIWIARQQQQLLRSEARRVSAAVKKIVKQGSRHRTESGFTLNGRIGNIEALCSGA
jgi:hypothetical protein